MDVLHHIYNANLGEEMKLSVHQQYRWTEIVMQQCLVKR